MEVSHRRSFKHYVFLLVGAQICQLFEYDLMTIHKRPKETNFNYTASILCAEHFKHYSFEREVI